MSDNRQTDLTTTKAAQLAIPAMPPGAALGELANSLNANLTDVDKARVAQKIAEAQVDLAKRAGEAEQRLYETSAEMARDLEFLKGISSIPVDTTTTLTRPDRTTTVTKNNNQVIIIIAIIFGIVALFLLAR
jgi:hypothetical protein